MSNVMELININKVYGKRVKSQVLYDVNLSIEEGSFNSIIGSSGSGKSTLLNIMGTLDKPTSGEIYIDGQNVSKLWSRGLSKIRNNKIGFIFQFHYLLSEFNVIENVLMPYRINHSFIRKQYRKRAEELLEVVGLGDKKKSKTYDLSGGQQQRVAIARALINNPKIILADEPTGSLDSSTSEDVYKLFREINSIYNSTFVIITHDDRVADKSDRVIRIEDGRILSDGK